MEAIAMTSGKTNDPGGRIYGIDLGTTYSAIAYVNDFGVPKIIPNEEGHRSTPSAVCFDGDRIIVGARALERTGEHPEDVVRFAKRFIGDPGYKASHGGKEFSIEEISSFILRKLVQDAEKNLKSKIKDVVITCPAYFGINERETTKIAGEIAGLNVRQVINEPTAAAIAYGAAEMEEPQLVLIYDLGGGTFDITMIDIRPESIKVIGTGGDPRLGGKDWDERIVQVFAGEFAKSTGRSGDEKKLLQDRRAFSELMLLAEKAKKALCRGQKADIPFAFQGETVKVSIPWDAFSKASEDLLGRTIDLTNDMLDTAKKKGYHRFDEILLVGGSTYMPQVARRLHEEFGFEPKLYHPEEAVAKGAAIYGWKMYLKDRLVERIAEKLIQKERSSGMDLVELSDNLEKVARKAAAKKPSLDDLHEDFALEMDTGPGYETAKSGRRADANRALEKELLDVDDDLPDIPMGYINEAVKEVAGLTGFNAGAVRNSMMEILDVASKSFGIIAKDETGKKVVSIIVSRNSVVPVTAKETFVTTVPNQKMVKIRIMESETHLPRTGLNGAEEIGVATLLFPQKMPLKTPVDISFSLSKDGRLLMTASERRTGSRVELNIETTSVISKEDLEQAKGRSASLSVV